MFSGIVIGMGRLRSVEPTAAGARMRFGTGLLAGRLSPGDSVAVNGCCLTAVTADADGFEVDVVPETLARTNLGDLEPGDPVNLEPSLRVGDQLGGHFVTGHVDDTGRVRRLVREDQAVRLEVDAPPSVRRYLVHKGSIAVDGVSLTVAGLDDAGFWVALIPHTLAVTTMGQYREGRRVNLEADLVGKYVARLLEPYTAAAGQAGPGGRAGEGSADGR